MVKIILEPARNGVIKKVNDDNHGGGKEHYQSIDVYEDYDNVKPNFEYVKRFFYELCEDLNIKTGNKFDECVIKIDTVWGSHYEPSTEDIQKRIDDLQTEIDLLKQWMK
jgi:hypothetical protein